MGIDRKGNHGGNGDLEVSTGLWISIQIPRPANISPPTPNLSQNPPPHTILCSRLMSCRYSHSLDCPPPSAISVRISQSYSGTDYAKALDVNLRQVRAYLDTYRNNGQEANSTAPEARFQSSEAKGQPESGSPVHLSDT